jgi:hypothetical protein
MEEVRRSRLIRRLSSRRFSEVSWRFPPSLNPLLAPLREPILIAPLHHLTGERFQDIIGTISLGSEMKSAMQNESDDEDAAEPAPTPASTSSSSTPSSSSTVSTSTKPAKPALTPEQLRKKKEKEEAEAKLALEKQKVRDERVRQLTDKLRDRLALFSEQAQSEEDEQIAEGGVSLFSPTTFSSSSD